MKWSVVLVPMRYFSRLDYGIDFMHFYTHILLIVQESLFLTYVKYYGGDYIIMSRLNSEAGSDKNINREESC